MSLQDRIAFEGQKRPTRKHFAALPIAEVRVAQADDGQWMWACSFHGATGGFGYAPLPKWGHFARSREDAIQLGAQELMGKLLTMKSQKVPPAVVAWLQRVLTPIGPVQGELFG